MPHLLTACASYRQDLLKTRFTKIIICFYLAFLHYQNLKKEAKSGRTAQLLCPQEAGCFLHIWKQTLWWPSIETGDHSYQDYTGTILNMPKKRKKEDWLLNMNISIGFVYAYANAWIRIPHIPLKQSARSFIVIVL